MARRRSQGTETFLCLQNWMKGQAAAERLAAHILYSEGFSSIDPSHPLGGRDGRKDIVCFRDNLKWIGAAYFARGKKPFSDIKKKFLYDLEGIKTNGADGLAFVTNQELKLADRKKLKALSEFNVEIYHLERISSILDNPRLYSIRLEFLEIEMTKEEQLSFFEARDQYLEDLRQTQKQILQSLNNVQTSSQPSLEIERLRKQLQTFFENRNDPFLYGARLPWERQEITIDQIEQLLQTIVKLAENLPTAVTYLDKFKNSLSEFKPLSEFEKFKQQFQELLPSSLPMGREPEMPETVENAKKILVEFNQLLSSVLTKQYEIIKNHDRIVASVGDLKRLAGQINS